MDFRNFSIFLLMCCAAASLSCPAKAESINLIPWPKSMAMQSGEMVFSGKSSICYSEKTLEPLAKIVAGEIFAFSQVSLKIHSGTANAGDIGLVLDTDAPEGEAYVVTVSDRAVATASNYKAVALASVTIEQLMKKAASGSWTIPAVNIKDSADYPMRAIQMCIKHQAHHMCKIKQGVDLCRQYKLNTLAMHMSNYQILWALSSTFREDPLPKGNSDGGDVYSYEEWTDLVEYARQRGVEIMPEWGPADFAMIHHGPMVQWFYKAVNFGDFKTFDANKTCLLSDPKFWNEIDTLTSKLAKLFYTSRYLHVGAIDGETGQWNSTADKAFMQANNLRGSGDVWAWILKKCYELNKKYDKDTMAFEGVTRSAAKYVDVPKDVCFFAYQTFYYNSADMIADGYRVLNAAWRPLYTCGGYPAQEIYAWAPTIVRHNGNPSINIHLPKSNRFIGTLLSTWEGGELGHLDVLNDRGAAMGERVWNESAGKSWDDFSQRLKPVMDRLDSIMYPVQVKADGLLADKRYQPIDRRWFISTEVFTDKLTLSLSTVYPNAKIYYTEADPYFIWTPYRPDPLNPKKTEIKKYDTKLYTKPIVYDQKRGPGIFRTQAFDENNKPIGGEYCHIFTWQPIAVTVLGGEDKFDELGRLKKNGFHKEATVSFSNAMGKKMVWRTAPASDKLISDKPYVCPIKITKTTAFWVGFEGEQSYPFHIEIPDDGYKANILSSDRMKISCPNKPDDPRLDEVCNGLADNPDNHWNVPGANVPLIIEIPTPRKMDTIGVYTWWGDGRRYRYRVEISEDNKIWKTIADFMEKGCSSRPEGETILFAVQSVKFIRITMNGNTTNNHNQLVEVTGYDSYGIN